jgi:hypothetical protein
MMEPLMEALVKTIQDKMVGKKITRPVLSHDGECVGFEMSNGNVVWIDCDPEGNDVGWLRVEK